MRSLKKNRYNRKGLKQGYWEVYYSNGQLHSRGSYKDGKTDGVWEFYGSNGEICREGTYIDGVFYGVYNVQINF